MLGPGRCIMFVFLELLAYVSRHRYVEGSCVVIPFRFYSAVEVTVPILGEIVVFLQAFDQMVDVGFVGVLHAKVINHQCEQNGVCGVSPKTRCLLALVVSLGGESLAQ